MGDVDCDAHVGEVESVTQSDEGQSDNVVEHQFLEILAGLFQLEHQDDCLLRPIRCLQEIVRLEYSFVCSMREAFVHSSSVEVPNRSPAHHIQAKGSKYSEVYGRIELFHEPSKLAPTAYSKIERQWPNHALHQKLPRKREDNGIEAHEGEVLGSLAILCDVSNVCR